MVVLRLAWRNIWRNTRRTLIVVTAVSVVGVTAMVWLRARAVRKEEEEEK